MATQHLTVTLAPNRLEERLPDHKALLGPHEAIAEANRCLYCSDAPCTQACPTHIDIPEFIRQISTDNLSGSAKTILQSNILGYSCARVCPVQVLCEGSCVYNELGESPIKIGKLQHVAVNHVLQSGERLFEAGPDSGFKVALIGAGPASLACAHELRRLGHACTIFEARTVPGGLNATGVAPYKINAKAALREVDYILGIGGIELRLGAEVGRDLGLAELARDFDAVFIGIGLGADSKLGIPGEDLEGVVGAIDWIERMRLLGGFEAPTARRVAILGGGNTALDVVREMLALGVPEVTLVYRRNQSAMPGYAHEWTWARQEGARAEWLAAPLEVLGENGKVTGLRCARTRLVQRPSGRASVELVEGADFVVPCDQVVVATGQSKLGALLAEVEGVQLEDGCVVIDPATGQTGHPAYFAGGDCVSGGKEVVNASAEGLTAARGIDAWLRSSRS